MAWLGWLGVKRDPVYEFTHYITPTFSARLLKREELHTSPQKLQYTIIDLQKIIAVEPHEQSSHDLRTVGMYLFTGISRHVLCIDGN